MENISINERIKKYRNFSGLSQEEVAEKLNMKLSTYSQMEREGNVSAAKIIDLAYVFNISPIVLMHGEDSIAAIIDRDSASIKNKPMTFKQDSLFIDEYGNFCFPSYEPDASELELMKKIKKLPNETQKEILDFVQKKYIESL